MNDHDGHRLGCIADDYTGATDLASALADRGFSVQLVFDLHAPIDALADADAIVVAGKTRTIAPDDAVAWSISALALLRRVGCDRYYFKYCSTFDSTPRGNIGPVTDALLDALRLRMAVAVPSYPANGRTVSQGLAYVNGELLSDSPMRHHPLTPMTDANLARWLAPQTRAEVTSVPLATVRSGVQLLQDSLRPPSSGTRIAVMDAVEDGDLALIAAALTPDILPTGGAALGALLPMGASRAARGWNYVPSGRRLVLSGSASAATREQVAHAKGSLPARKLEVGRLPDVHYRAELAQWVGSHWDADPQVPVLLYATDSPQDLAPSAERRQVADAIEATLAAVATLLLGRGLGQLLVAGGETAGRVVAELGIALADVGPAIAAGVPWIAGETAGGRRLALALKSGNFGDPELFSRAWEVLS